MKNCAMIAIFSVLGVGEVALAVSPGVTAQILNKNAEKKEKDKAKPPSPPKPVPDKEHRPGRGRDRDDWRRNRDRDRNRNRNYPVYVPAYPPHSYPYPTYPQPYIYDDSANREAALLEAVGRQMRFALRENEVLKPFKLDTDTVGDSVEIHGAVNTIAQMQLALDVARNIDQRTRIVITRIKVRNK